MLTAEITLLSIGEAARNLGVSLERLVDSAVTLGIRAVERRDGIAWLEASDVERIREHLDKE